MTRTFPRGQTSRLLYLVINPHLDPQTTLINGREGCPKLMAQFPMFSSLMDQAVFLKVFFKGPSRATKNYGGFFFD